MQEFQNNSVKIEKLQAKLQVSRRKIGNWMGECSFCDDFVCVGMVWYFVGRDMNNENVTSSVIEYEFGERCYFGYRRGDRVRINSRYGMY